jgi:hypothetical protein
MRIRLVQAQKISIKNTKKKKKKTTPTPTPFQIPYFVLR